MNWNKGITCAICGAAVCGHIWHESHEEKDSISRQFVRKPIVEQRVYGRSPHGEDPEAPTGPLQWPGTIAVTTSTGTGNAVSLPPNWRIYRSS